MTNPRTYLGACARRAIGLALAKLAREREPQGALEFVTPLTAVCDFAFPIESWRNYLARVATTIDNQNETPTHSVRDYYVAALTRLDAAGPEPAAPEGWPS